MSVYIQGRGVCSPVGLTLRQNLASLSESFTNFTELDSLPIGRILDEIPGLASRQCKELPRSAQLGLLVSAEALKSSQDRLSLNRNECAVVAGSSRGAADLLELSYSSWKSGERISPKTSPLTTSGILSSSVSREHGLHGPGFTISSACSTGLHTVGIASMMIRLGHCGQAMVLSSESCITSFTLNMLKQARVYGKGICDEFPCRPWSDQSNGMILSEGAGAIYLTNDRGAYPICAIAGYGAATERVSLTGVSDDGAALVEAMGKACKDAGVLPADIDVVVGHGSGTLRGDLGEIAACNRFFEGRVPPVCVHKWMTGHMLGASSLYSLIVATELFNFPKLPRHPYAHHRDLISSDSIDLHQCNNILCLSLGFGGNAAAIILTRG